MAINVAKTSKTRLTIANKENCTPRELAVGELMALGWKPMDAAIAVGLVQEGSDKDNAQIAVEGFVGRDCVKKICDKRQKQIKNGCVVGNDGRLHPTPSSPGSNRGRKAVVVEEDGTEAVRQRKAWEMQSAALTDAEILDEMWATIQALERDNPKRAQLLETYYKTKRRQGEKDGDDTTIHFYLPKPECDSCPFRDGNVISAPSIRIVEGDRAADRDGEEKPQVPKRSHHKKKDGEESTGWRKAGRPRKDEKEPEPEDEGDLFIDELEQNGL